MIKKVLIANRGEIVNRIKRTCDRLGLDTVAVYADADRDAGYLETATESRYIGPSAPVKSYLNIDALVGAIRDSGADAVHPGYGFLSESAAFARAVTEAGAVWIGPDPGILADIESKCHCRQIADRLGVPVTPGSIGPISGPEEIEEIARRVGLPVLLKLDRGGGGKGIETISSLESAQVTRTLFESLQRIGRMAFACGDVYVEKALISPRHIEVQFVADSRGHVVCFGERECSIQRRFQKIIEESPSTVVTPEDRETLYGYTKRLIREMGYTGAGTVEYLRDGEGRYYFMEINARLQVEHPVTELVTGVDLVEQQIRVANGSALLWTQEDVELKGHAIECRVYAEDPKTFQPAPGEISRLNLPRAGDHVRVEHALTQGYRITPFYDPMLLKLITWGETREQCIGTMLSSLRDTQIEGVPTTVNTGIAIMRNRSFAEGNFSTAFLRDEPLHFEPDNYVVTISRQFGSLGRPVAKKVAELLGINYYDRDILEEVAQKMGLPTSAVDDMEEPDAPAFDRMKYPLGTGSEEVQEEIFRAQQGIIRELARRESCVFVGRCADYILRNHENHFSVYIYAPLEVRQENCVKALGMTPDQACRMIQEIDEARRSYSMHFAKTYSEDTRYKDILIDGSLYDNVDDTAQALVTLIRKKFDLAEPPEIADAV